MRGLNRSGLPNRTLRGTSGTIASPYGAATATANGLRLRNSAPRGVVQTHMCIRCRENEVEHELGICERCALPTCVEYLTGLQRLERYLAAWAAFRDWESAPQPA